MTLQIIHILAAKHHLQVLGELWSQEELPRNPFPLIASKLMQVEIGYLIYTQTLCSAKDTDA